MIKIKTMFYLQESKPSFFYIMQICQKIVDFLSNCRSFTS